MRKAPKTSLLCCRHLMLHLEKPIKLQAYPLLQEITETNPVKDLIGPGRANDQPSHFVYEYHLPSLSMANALNNKLIDSRTEKERDEGWMVLSDKILMTVLNTYALRNQRNLGNHYNGALTRMPD